MKINSYEDLEIWQLGMDLLVAVYSIKGSLPFSERYNLSDQMGRAAVSIPSNIAEGWGRGRGASQAQFIKIARGSLFELVTQIEACRRLGLITEEIAERSRLMTDVLGKKMNAYLAWLETSSVREASAEYGALHDHADQPTD